jgi:alpha-L-fucosidase
MKLKFPLLTLALLAVPVAFAASTQSAKVAPRDFQWWRDGRFGMFIHWGPSSLTGKEISWSRKATGMEKYDALYKEFNPVKFNAAEWVAVAQAAGMKYIVLTAKHHDGFMLWDTRTSDYNIMKSPFGRDVVAELAKAARAAGIPFCVYFSPGDWKDPDCRNPATNAKFVERMHAQITELLTKYGKIPLVWIDFDGYPCPSEPRETATLMRRLQPGVLITCRLEALHPDESHGRVGPWGDYATPEQRVGSYCDTVPWETCMTIGRQWSWKPDEEIKSLQQCLHTLVRTVGGDGNLLFNVGPRPDGEIEPAHVARLKEMGDWLSRHGEAIYGTRGGPWYPTRNSASTRNEKFIYVHALRLANGGVTLPALPAKVKSATLLDGTLVQCEQKQDSLTLTVPAGKQDANITVIKLAVNKKPLKLAAIVPPLASQSLAYRKPATVSSSIAPQFMHTAQAALDDDDSTYWSPGRDEALAGEILGKKFESVMSNHSHPVWKHDGWLEVDLGAETKVARARINEHDRYSPVSSWRIEYQKGGQWRTVVEGTAIGKSLEVTLPEPVTGRKFRLQVAAPGRPAILEFQLF